MSHLLIPRGVDIGKRFCFGFLITLCLLAVQGCQGGEYAAVKKRVQLALASPDRPDGDSARDAGRKPLEMVQFFGLKSGMTVLDVSSSSGYNVDVFAAAVGPSGKVYAHNTKFGLELFDGGVRQGIMARLDNNRLSNAIFWNREFDDLDLASKVDLAYVGLNLHDYYNFSGEEAAIAILKSIRRTLKKDGKLGLTDHRGDAGKDNVKLHRIEESLARRLLEAAGFIVEKDSDSLSNSEDDHSLSAVDKAIRGKTDRFLILAGKGA